MVEVQGEGRPKEKLGLLRDSLLVWLALCDKFPNLGRKRLEQQVKDLREIIEKSSLRVLPDCGKRAYLKEGIVDRVVFNGDKHVEISLEYDEDRDDRRYKVSVREGDKAVCSNFYVKELKEILPHLKK